MNAEKKRKIPYPLDNLSKITEFFGVPITALFDPNHLFYIMDKDGKYERRVKT